MPGRLAPLRRLERRLLPPEGNALSTELQGQTDAILTPHGRRNKIVYCGGATAVSGEWPRRLAREAAGRGGVGCTSCTYRSASIPEAVETFRRATIENARSSLREPGVVRFDVAQRGDDPTQFVLVEIYRTADDPPRHRLTAHYAAWRDAVEPILAEPRSKVEYVNVYPEDSTWE